MKASSKLTVAVFAISTGPGPTICGVCATIVTVAVPPLGTEPNAHLTTPTPTMHVPLLGTGVPGTRVLPPVITSSTETCVSVFGALFVIVTAYETNVGSAVVRHLSAAGHELVGIARRVPPEDDARVAEWHAAGNVGCPPSWIIVEEYRRLHGLPAKAQ